MAPVAYLVPPSAVLLNICSHIKFWLNYENCFKNLTKMCTYIHLKMHTFASTTVNFQKMVARLQAMLYRPETAPHAVQVQ